MIEPTLTVNWVKVVGSDFRLEYPMMRVDEPDGYHFHFEPDYSRPAKRVPLTPQVLEDHGDGTYTGWGYTLYGPVGQSGRLRETIKVQPLRTKRDFEAALATERLINKALVNQAAMVTVARASK